MYKLVIVEDEHIEREALATLVDWRAMGLSLAGCFEAGEQALAYARENPFDVLFTDIRLIGMSGLDLARDILQIRPNVKILVNSGYSDFEYARRAIALKAVSYLTKPLDLDELRDTVRETLRQLQAEEASRDSAARLEKLVMTELPALRNTIMEKIDNGSVSGGEAAEALQIVGLDTDRNIIRRIMAHIAGHLDQKLSLEYLSEVFRYSPNYIGIAFKKDAGMTLTDYVRGARMEKARELLREPGARISEVAARVGYPNVSYFCSVFRKEYGVNPGEYREHA